MSEVWSRRFRFRFRFQSFLSISGLSSPFSPAPPPHSFSTPSRKNNSSLHSPLLPDRPHTLPPLLDPKRQIDDPIRADRARCQRRRQRGGSKAGRVSGAYGGGGGGGVKDGVKGGWGGRGGGSGIRVVEIADGVGELVGLAEGAEDGDFVADYGGEIR